MSITTPLAFRSQYDRITAGEWLAQITLCLAPLIAHIIIGIPSPVYLHRTSPRWHDSMGFYNPTTILWRYFATADRALRAKNWKPIDMAATNSRFWTSHGWDGSEEMMEKSKTFCTRVPPKAHARLLSRGALESGIIFIQGVQACIDLSTTIGEGSWQPSIATVFYPLALFGFLRMPAAYWLSEDGAYADTTSYKLAPRIENEGLGYEMGPVKTEPLIRTELLHYTEYATSYNSYPPSNWRGWITRVYFPSSVLGIMSLSMFFFNFLISNDWKRPITALTEASLFCFLSVTSAAILGFYGIKDKTRTTIIPCIQSLWYKIYTVLLFIGGTLLVTFAAIETRKTPCGIFTTLRDVYPCTSGSYFHPLEAVQLVTQTGPANSTAYPFGGIYKGLATENGTNVSVFALDGWCSGELLESVRIKTRETVPPNSTNWLHAFPSSPNVNITFPENWKPIHF
ncbi:hypothetical protein BGZ60DRAFT_522591 [Tricladium varicosporioides]|nr:hypothetical protein BGZ60DRAFT_522591 [Hymenoscyphus varicosporioides]